LWHKAFKNSRYTEGYASEFLKTFCQQHLSTPHPQKSLNSGYSLYCIRSCKGIQGIPKSTTNFASGGQGALFEKTAPWTPAKTFH
jgi:hypothetical protein